MAEPGAIEDDLNRAPTDQELGRLQWTTVLYYLHETNPDNGLTRDKTDLAAPCTIAAVGLALASFPVIVERGVVIRKFAAKIVRRRLRSVGEVEEVARYRVEPYAVVADIYGEPPHTGRGGWTWYTGSASWLYRVALEAILGFRRAGDTLRVEPCVPPRWPGYEITYRHGSATYRVQVDNPAGTGRGVVAVSVDGQPAADRAVPLRDDGREHDVRVTLGNAKG